MNEKIRSGRRLRVGLVGAGKMGMHHAGSVRRLDDLADLVAVADGSAEAREAAAAAHGVRTYEDLAGMLDAGGVDVVHICTGPATHVPLAEQAIRRGVHVYVEKPIAPTVVEMRRLVALAEENGVSICAGHQLLFEPPMVAMRRYLKALGRPVHVESYFSYRTVRRAPGGRAPLRADLQLLDILPHPVYLLLEALRLALPGERTELKGLDVGPTGTVHALVARGNTTGTLVVTLEGRPVESYLRVVGTNGVAHADFVRGTLQRLIGPGISGIDKVLNPYRTATQLAKGTTGALGRRLLKRQRSYPGLAELFEAFYESILRDAPSPTPPEALEETVAIWQQVAEALERITTEADARIGPPQEGPLVVLTGGTGFLGRATAERLLADGFAVRVLARRLPAAWERVDGADYAVADLGAGVDAGLLEGATAVVHCAAETAGSWPEHQRNSIDATENILRAAAEAGVRRIIHVSSMAVIRSTRGPASESSPTEEDGRSRGPYVWGKLISERLAGDLADELGLELRIVRPGAIIDSADFDPPGRLGKRVGPLFVAVGSRNGRFGTVERAFAADVLAWMVSHFDEAPRLLHLIDADLPTRGEMVERMRETNPDLRVIWLPTFVLVPLSGMAVVMQRVLRPGSKPIVLSKVFADQELDTTLISGVRDRATLERSESGREERQLAAAESTSG